MKVKDSNARSFMFSRFMGIFHPLNRRDFESYTDIKESIQNLNIGFLPNNIDSDFSHYYPLIRAIKYLSITYESSMKLQVELFYKIIEFIKERVDS